MASKQPVRGAAASLTSPTALEQLVEEVTFYRTKGLRRASKAEDSGFVILQGTTHWTDIFVRHFLFAHDRSHDADDLLFFVRKRHVRGSSRFIPRFQTSLEVFRKDSKKLPIGDPDIDWEETVYLNLIIHQFEYTLTLATCTRTSPKHLQILKRYSQKVYASPSRRRMDAKGDQEEVTYPNIFFMVDNFDEVFSDLDVRDGEMICAELLASDKDGSSVGGVAFLGAIGYDTLKRVYEARTSATNRMAHRMKNFSFFQTRPGQRMEFMRMKGPRGKGHAEMAVTKAPGCGADTPSSEPGVPFTDMYESDFEDDDDTEQQFRQRRMSDPSSTLNNFVRSWRSRPSSAKGSGSSGYQQQPQDNMRVKSRSESEGLDSYSSGFCEVEAGDPRDDEVWDVHMKCVPSWQHVVWDGHVRVRRGSNEQPRASGPAPPQERDLDGTDHIPLWSMKGALQSYHFWKESRRLQSVPLNAYLTYVSLPWYAIIRDVLDRREPPILTF